MEAVVLLKPYDETKNTYKYNTEELSVDGEDVSFFGNGPFSGYVAKDLIGDDPSAVKVEVRVTREEE